MLLGPKNSVWSSFADTTVPRDSRPSPPGLPSMMTGWPHFCCSFSTTSRAAVSDPEPGPNGSTKRTECVGHCWATLAVVAVALIASASAATTMRRTHMLGMIPPGMSGLGVHGLRVRGRSRDRALTLEGVDLPIMESRLAQNGARVLAVARRALAYLAR